MNIALHIDSFGTGPDVLAFHGTPQAPRDLKEFLLPLESSFRFHLVHSPGAGKTPTQADIFSLDGVEDAIAEYVAREISGSYAIVGYSGGTYRAFRATARGLLNPRTLVALGPVPFIMPQMRDGWAGALDALEAGADLFPAMVAGMFSPAFGEANPDILAKMLAEVQEIGVKPVAQELRAVSAAPDFLEELGKMDFPVLLRVGELDANTPPGIAEEAARILPQATLQIVPAVAHALHHEDIEGTRAAIVAALS